MIKTLKAFDLEGKNILLRVDFNVPVVDEKVVNNFRIKSALPTITTCIESGASITLMSHLGRPNGINDSRLSLMGVGEELASLLEMPIKFSDNPISSDAIDTSLSLKPGEIHLLENLRFDPAEKSNDPKFSSKLARHGQIYINDAFGTAHRNHASNVGVVRSFKHYGIGWLMDKELNFLQRFMINPKTPLTLILGGSKISSKIALIDQFLSKADNIIIGGGMAFTFLKAKGKDIGGSLIDEKMIKSAKKIINKARVNNVKLLLPSDFICGKNLDDSNPKGPFEIGSIPDGLMGLDIGPQTLNKYNGILGQSNTIVWNGPMGVFEKKGYENGSRQMAIHLTSCITNGAKVIVGGGDTASALENFNLLDEMTHVSTGGGASLELLSGRQLPALKVLEN